MKYHLFTVQTFNRKLIGSRIREARQITGYTQPEVADLLEMSQPNVAKMEKEGSLTINNLFKFANLFRVSIDYLLGVDISLTKNETEILAAYRALPNDDARLLALRSVLSLGQALNDLQSKAGKPSDSP